MLHAAGYYTRTHTHARRRGRLHETTAYDIAQTEPPRVRVRFHEAVGGSGGRKGGGTTHDAS